MELDAAVKCAVDECIREGILADFLRKNRAEVIAMSIFEYDKEEEEKKLRKAEFKAGYENGFENGFENGQNTGGINKTKEFIQLMLKAGEPMEKIALYTGCTVDEVKNTIKDFQ